MRSVTSESPSSSSVKVGLLPFLAPPGHLRGDCVSGSLPANSGAPGQPHPRSQLSPPSLPCSLEDALLDKSRLSQGGEDKTPGEFYTSHYQRLFQGDLFLKIRSWGLKSKHFLMCTVFLRAAPFRARTRKEMKLPESPGQSPIEGCLLFTQTHLAPKRPPPRIITSAAVFQNTAQSS